MEKKTVFSIPGVGADFDWKKGIRWSDYHEVIGATLMPRISLIERTLSGGLQSSDREYAKEVIYEAADDIVMMLMALKDDFENLEAMIEHNLGAASAK